MLKVTVSQFGAGNGQVGTPSPSPNINVSPVVQQPTNQPGGMASIPNNNPNMKNLPMNELAQGQGQTNPDQNAEQTAERIGFLMDKVVSGNYNNEMQWSAIKTSIGNLIKEVSDEKLKTKLDILVQSMSVNADPKKQTAGMPTPQELAKEINMMVHNSIQVQKQMPKSSVASVKVAAPAGGGAPNKKKTRGNPFKVLMGQVGKLLEGGVKKGDIVRYLKKKKIWSDEMIEKAVDIVKDYNKKDKRDGVDDDSKDKSKDDDSKDKSKDKPKAKPATASFFNMMQREAVRNTQTVYDVQPDFYKRSTAELMARAKWLNSLKNYGPSDYQYEGRKADDKTGVVSQIKDIRDALSKRGFKNEELDDLL